MRKALIVVDMQNDFINGSLENEEAKHIVENVVDVIKNFNGDIFVTMDTHHNNYLDTLEGNMLPIMHCLEETEGWKLNEKVQKSLDEKEEGYIVIIKKETFGSQDLPEIIRLKGKFDEIYILGLCTDICVISNALLLRAAFPNTRIILRSDCCAGTTKENHLAAIKVAKSCQIEEAKINVKILGGNNADTLWWRI